MELHEELGAVRREVELDAARDEVWTRIGSPEGLGSWLGDEVDLPAVQPGARGTIREGDVERRVTVEEVEPGRRVALSWCADGEDASLVEVTLDDVDERRTRVVVVEVPLVTLRVAALPLRAALSPRRAPGRGPQMAAVA